MFQSIFKNQVLMTSMIAILWIVPGIIFTSATNRKYKNRKKDKQLKKISKLYPQH